MTNIRINPQNYSVRVSKDGDVVKVLNSNTASRVGVSNFVPVATGSGDMTKAVYDTDYDGIVDNSEMLGGQLPSYYLDSSNISGQIPATKISTGIISNTEFDYLNGLDQNLSTSSNVSFNSATITDLYVAGSSWVINAGQVSTSDNIIILNNGEVGSGVTAGSSGIQIDRGSSPDYQFLFDESSDSFKIGEIGSLQKVATREDSPTSGGIAFYNPTAFRFDTETGLYYDSTTNRLGVGTITPSGANANVLLDVRGHIRSALSSSAGYYYFSSAATNPYLAYGVIADSWTFADANSYKMTVTASGRVGIGTTTPSHRLHTYSSDNTINSAFFEHLTTSNAEVMVAKASSSTTYTGSVIRATSAMTASSTYNLLRADNSGTNLFTVKGNGTSYISANLGIGITTPTEMLHLQNGSLLVNNSSTGVATRIAHYTGSTPIASNDSSQVFTTLSAAGSYPFNGLGNLVLQPRTSAARDVVIMAGSTTPSLVATFTNTGAVGIGTSTPSTKLHVAGAIRVAGTGTNVMDLSTASAGTFDRLDFKAVSTNLGVSFQLVPNGTNAKSKLVLSNDSDTSNFGSLYFGLEGGDAYITSQSVGAGYITASTLHLGTKAGSTLGGANWTNVVVPGGNFGVGTTSPSYPLHVVGASYHTDTMYIGDGKTIGSFSGNGSQIAFTNAVGTQFKYGAGSVGMTISATNGFLGANTVTPSDAIHIYGDAKGMIIENTGESDSGITFWDAQDHTQEAKILYGAGDNLLKFNNNGNTALSVDANRNTILYTGALATSATNGFLYITSAGGTPTGVPTSYSGRVPIMYDTAANKLYVYNSGWKGVTLS